MLSGQSNEKSTVVNLFKSEFNLDSDISSCKRLGQPLNGKFLPRLVVLKNTDHVNHILSDAKKLRKSVDTLVRDQVYVNPPLTHGEARAAFEQRCQKRQRNQRLIPPVDNCSQHHSELSVAKANNRRVSTQDTRWRQQPLILYRVLLLRGGLSISVETSRTKANDAHFDSVSGSTLMTIYAGM